MASVRRVARWARFVLGVLFLVGIIVQFVLAGYGWFAPGGNFDVHETLGYTIMHWLPLLILIAGLVAWKPFRDLGLTVAIGVLGLVQPVLAGAGEWAGVFHPLNALVLAFLTHRLTDHDWRALRRAETPSAAEARPEVGRA